MVLRVISAIVGVVLVLVGVVFVGQGTNVIHGSSMSGHGVYAVLGVVLLVLGLAVLRSVRPRPDRTS
jgi:hypothetical protein